MAGGAIKAGEAYVQLALKGRDKVARGLKRIKASFASVAKGVGAAGAIMAGALVLVASALAPAVKAASDMQETMSKFDTVFGENSKAMKAWSDDFANAVGRSKKQVAGFLSSNQDLFVPMGFDDKGATEISKQLTALTIDLASFNNKSDEDVMNDLQAAMTGSGEVMKKYGVILSEAAVKQELMNQGIDPSKANEQAKALARLNIIMSGTTAAQGDAIATGDSFANQQKRFWAIVDNLAVTIGEALLPTLTEWFNELNALMGMMSDTEGEGLGFTDMLSQMGDTVAFLGSPIQFLIKSVSAVAGVFRLAQSAISATLASMAWLVEMASKSALAGAIFGDGAEGMADVAGAMKDDLDRLAKEQFEAAGVNFELAFTDELSDRIKAERDKAAKAIKDSAERTAVDFSAVNIKEKLAEAGQAAEKVTKAAVEIANPESLEANSVQAFMKFRENKDEQHKRKLEKSLGSIDKQLRKAPMIGVAG